MRHKRGNAVLDLLMMPVVLAALALVLIIGSLMATMVNEKVQAEPDFGAAGKEAMQATEDRNLEGSDNLFVFFFVLMWVFVVVASFLVDSHPILFGISLVLLIFVFAYGGYIANFVGTFAGSDSFVGVSAYYAKTLFIMDNWVTFAVLVGFSVLMVQYGKS